MSLKLNLKDLAKAGARARLVELENEKLALFKMFPELMEGAGAKIAPKGKGKPRDRAPEVIELLKTRPDGVVTPKQLAEQYGLTGEHASGTLQRMVRRKLLKRAGRGRYKLP